MKCEEIQPNLLDYGKGLLSGPEAREIRAHIAGCEECAALLDEELSFARRLCASNEEHTPRDVWALVRAKTKPRRLRVPSLAWFGGIRGAVTATAAAALVAFTLYGLNMEQPNSNPAGGGSVHRQSAQTTPNGGGRIVAVKWSDDPLGNHTDAMVDVIDEM